MAEPFIEQRQLTSFNDNKFRFLHWGNMTKRRERMGQFHNFGHEGGLRSSEEAASKGRAQMEFGAGLSTMEMPSEPAKGVDGTVDLIRRYPLLSVFVAFFAGIIMARLLR